MTLEGTLFDLSPYSVRVLTTIAELDGTAAAWRSLWSRCEGARTPYLSFEWVRTWAGHYAAHGELNIFVVEDGRTVLGIMPLVRTRYPIGLFSVNALETVGGESRNLIALVAPGAVRSVARSVASYLNCVALAQGLVLRLALVPAEHHFLGELVDALKDLNSGTAMRLKTASVAPYVLLPSTWEEFELSLGRRRRKVLGRAQRKIDRLCSDFRIRTCGGDQIAGTMDHLFRLHQARWAFDGIRGLFRDERSRSFHLDVARECDRLGWLDLTEMQIDGTTVSAHLALVLDDVAYVMRSGRDIAYNDYDIGHIHERSLLRRWIGAGLKEADFLRGAEPYKFYWTRNYRVYHELLAVRGGAFGGSRLSVVGAWLRVSRFLSTGHPPRELIAYLRSQRVSKNELRKMGITLRLDGYGLTKWR